MLYKKYIVWVLGLLYRYNDIWFDVRRLRILGGRLELVQDILFVV